jgi:tetratricopeptide (TPR) repeat protein
MRQRIGDWAAGILLLSLTLSGGSRVWAQGSTVGSFLAGAVTVELQDGKGAPLRSINGTLLRQGVIVPISALAGASKAVVKTRGGAEWTTESVSATNASIDLALLALPQAPEFFLTLPDNSSFMPGSKVTLVNGPGASPDTVSSTIYYTYQLRDLTDYIAVAPGLKGAAPALDPTGRLLGVTGDLSEPGYPMGFLVPAVSVGVVAAAESAPTPIASIAGSPPVPWLDRNSVTGLCFRGALLTTAAEYEKARNFLTLALKKDPNSPDAHYYMGRVLFAQQQYTQAADELQKAGELDSSFHMAYHMAGAAYHQAGKYPDAEKMYAKALAIKPAAPETYCNLGGTLFMEGRYDKAVEAFRQSISIDPRYAMGLAYFNLAKTYNQMGLPAKTEEVHADLLKIDPAWAQRLRSELDAKR